MAVPENLQSFEVLLIINGVSSVMRDIGAWRRLNAVPPEMPKHAAQNTHVNSYLVLWRLRRLDTHLSSFHSSVNENLERNSNSPIIQATDMENTLREFEKTSLIPDLTDAASCASFIVKAMKHKKDAFKHLGTYTANAVCAVCRLMSWMSVKDLTPTVVENVYALKTAVENIKMFAEAQLKHKSIKTRLQLTFSRADLEKIEELKENLNKAIARFGLRTNIAETQERLVRMLLEEGREAHEIVRPRTSSTTVINVVSQPPLSNTTAFSVLITDITGSQTLAISNVI